MTTHNSTPKSNSNSVLSVLSDLQNLCVVKVKSCVNERSLPASIQKHSQLGQIEYVIPNNSVDTSERGQEIENMQQFYSWFQELDEETVTEEKYSSRIESLKLYRDYSDKILGEVDHALAFIQQLENNYNLVSKKTGELHEACEVLVQQQFADSLEKKLTFFNELPKITQKFSTSLSIYEPTFKSLLDKLDECIDFIDNHREFQDAETYLLKYRQLQHRGLSMLKNEIVQTLKSITAQLLSQMKVKGVEVTESSSIDTMYYIKFRTVAPKIHPLCQEIEKRATISDYQNLLQDCHHCYFQQRRILLNGIINTNVLKLCQQSNDLCAMTRSGCLYLIAVCHNEYLLYQHFFSTVTSALTLLLEGFSTSLYDAFRPIYIRSHNIEMLCSLVYMLKTEILSEQLEQRGKSVEAFRPIVSRMLQDVQERLTYLAQTYIRDEISGYVIQAADLNYPEKLLTQQTTKEEPDSSTTTSTTMIPFKSIYKTWFPTLERTLVCLSKLYLTVDSRVFEGLATEAIGECTNSLVQASRLLSSKKSPLDATLFLIKHLLTLREQITPFDATFSITEQTLDFSHMRGAFRKILTSGSSLFSFTSQNPLLGVVQQAVPTIETQQVDSRKDLERELKAAIEAFIMLATKRVTESLLSFLTKANAFLNVKGASSSAADSLRNQVFASPEKLKLILEETDKKISEDMVQLLSQMQVYIPNPATQAILYRPIRDQVLESLSQFANLIIEKISNKLEEAK